MKHWFRVLGYFRRDAWRLALVFVLMLASTGANLLKPWPIAILVDSVLGHKPWPEALAEVGKNHNQFALVTIGAMIVLVLHFGQGLLSTACNYLSIAIGLRGLRRVRNQVFAALQSLSWRFHQGSLTGDLVYRASWDTYAFQTAFQQGLVTAATAGFSLVLMVLIMSRLNAWLTLVAIGSVPLLMLSIKLFGRQMRLRGMTAQQVDSQVTSLVQQNIAALPLIQSYTLEEQEQKRFVAQTALAETSRLSQHGWELLYGLGITLVFGLGTAAIVWLGSREVLANKLTIGELLIFIAYLAQLYDPLNQLSRVGATVSTARASTQRVFEILDTTEQVKDSPGARTVQMFKPASAATDNQVRAPEELAGSAANTPLLARGEIAFHNVTFGYDKEIRVLRDVSLRIPAGSSVAILGQSGAGKTTLLRLVPRFYDPDAGSVTLDGADLRQLRLRELRQHIAVVFQESILLPATVAENIALGHPNASPAEIEAAARAANAHEFIQRLPKKYETVVGEGAARLSVGETQRVGLARAFLKDAPILILDEPTSALDAGSEALIVASLNKLMRGRTTLLVAHRLSTIRGVDQVIVMEQGGIMEQGAPNEILNLERGYYARMLKASRDAGSDA